MKKKISMLIMFLVLATGILCAAIPDGENDNETQVYFLSHFDDIVLDSTTMNDVEEIAHIEKMYITSFGAVADFPTTDGRWIQIKFYGPDLNVGSIESVDSPWA